MLQCYSVGVLLRRKMKAAGRSLMIGRCQFDLQSQILAYILYPAAISLADRTGGLTPNLSWENVKMGANIYSLSGGLLEQCQSSSMWSSDGLGSHEVDLG